jgi:hypothetical protein
VLGLADEAEFEHPPQHVLLAHRGAFRIDDRVVGRGPWAGRPAWRPRGCSGRGWASQNRYARPPRSRRRAGRGRSG